MKILTLITSAIAALFAFPIFIFAQPAQTRTVPLSLEEQQLNNVRRANEEAQAEYYREMTRKLQQPSPTPPPKTLGQVVAENPASVSVMLAALFAAGVGLLTLYVNNRNALRTQKDTQFYEALKRFGDKDSPTVRASAAGLLAQMGKDGGRRVRVQKKLPFLKIENQRSYYVTALDQLITGLLLEENLIALESIRDAIRQLIPDDPNNIFKKLYKANIRIQSNLSMLLAEYFVVKGLTSVPPTSYDNQEYLSLWERAASLTTYHNSTIRSFIEGSGSFSTAFYNCLEAFNPKHEEEKGDRLNKIQNNIRLVSKRLRANVDLCCTSLGMSNWDGGTHYSFHYMFLAGGNSDLKEANLEHVDLSYSYLAGVWLFKANMAKTGFIESDLRGATLSHAILKDAWLLRAKLEGTGLDGADLTNAKLAEINIKDFSRFKDTNWWKADFYLSVSKGSVDLNTLEQLYNHFSELVPQDLKEVHPSVKGFVEEKRKNVKPLTDSKVLQAGKKK